ncbi:TPA: hypothetical protein ACH3X1_013404 [Trebouxia sp. C0004]
MIMPAHAANYLDFCSVSIGSFLGVTQEQTAGVKHTAAQEGRAGQCCDKPSEQQPEGGLGQALRGLRLPTQEETKQHLQKFMAQQ